MIRLILRKKGYYINTRKGWCNLMMNKKKGFILCKRYLVLLLLYFTVNTLNLLEEMNPIDSVLFSKNFRSKITFSYIYSYTF